MSRAARRTLLKRRARPELGLRALGVVPLGALPVPGLPHKVSLQSVVAAGPNRLLLSAEGSGAVWSVRRDRAGRLHLGGCARPPYQPVCAPSPPGQVDFSTPMLRAGRDVYVGDGHLGIIVHWRLQGGKLRYRGCVSGLGVRGCRDAGAASPDLTERLMLVRGGRILAASTELGHVVLFKRDRQTGSLQAAGCVGAGDGCRDGVLPQQAGMWAAGAGNWLFVGAGDSLTSVDPGLGGASTAQRVDCVTDAGSALAEVDSLPGCHEDDHAAGDSDFGMPLFADDRFVYASDFTSGGIGSGLTWWRHDAGKLTFAGCYGEGDSTGDGCSPGTAAAEDPSLFAEARSGKFLAVGATTAQGIALLRRTPSTGAVRPVGGRRGCVTQNGQGGNPFNPSPGSPPPPSCIADRRLGAVINGIALRPAGDVLYATVGHRLLAYAIR